jgi:rhodanese-related sulfurtransferase
MTKTAMQMIGEARAQVGMVEPKKAADELGAGAVFVDVREPEEWQHGHIDRSVAAPRGLLEFFADPTSPRHNQALDPGRRVIVVCASGARVTRRPDPRDDGLRRRGHPRRRSQGLDRGRAANERARVLRHLVLIIRAHRVPGDVICGGGS